jgi:hypothetical protein
MDRLIIVSQNQNIQDYTNKTNNIFMPKFEVLKCQIQERPNRTPTTQ